MDRRIETVCLWCGPAFLVCFVVGFWFVGGLVPPPSQALGADEIAAFYREHAESLRAGLLICLLGAPLLIPFTILLTMQLKRGNPRLAPLAYTQLLAGLLLVLEFMLPVILMGAAAMRPERSPESILVLNDFALIILLWGVAAPCAQYAAIALAVLWDGSDSPWFPRWVGWLNVLVCVIFATGAPMLWVRTGPFAFDGLLAFWAVLVSFSLWIVGMFWAMRRVLAEHGPAAA
jgi:hypothetical protein